jgi:hypothetical protein
MKREIVCSEKCKPKFSYKLLTDEKGISYIADPYPGEYCKTVKGKAKGIYICDACGKSIKKGDVAIAISIWADYTGLPYFEWEDDFIEREDFFDSPEYLEGHPQKKGK